MVTLRQEWKVVLHEMRVLANPSVRSSVVIFAMLERLGSGLRSLISVGFFR